MLKTIKKHQVKNISKKIQNENKKSFHNQIINLELSLRFKFLKNKTTSEKQTQMFKRKHNI